LPKARIVSPKNDPCVAASPRNYLKALAGLTSRKRPLKRDELHQAIGAAKKEAGRDARHVKVHVTLHGKGKTQTATLTYRPDRQTLRVARRREGRSLLRTNMTDSDPVKVWEHYLDLTEIEQAFKELKESASRRTSSSHSWPMVCRSRSRHG
jgi:hypothetical protein